MAVKAGESPLGTLATLMAGLKSSNTVRKLQQRSISLYLSSNFVATVCSWARIEATP
jgi:hypothetical protein